jgi:hypothetical protein
MPRGERFGCRGVGSGPGRGMGYRARCAISWPSGGGHEMGRCFGRGRPRHGRRGGPRWGRAEGVARWDHFAPPDWGPMPAEMAERQELAALKARAERLRSRLDAVQTQIDALEGGH